MGLGLAIAFAVAGCREAGPPKEASAPPTPQTRVAAKKASPAKKTSDPVFAELRATLIKRLASDDAAAKNLGSFKVAIKRQKRELTLLRASGRIPRNPPTQPALLAELRRAVGETVTIASVALGKAPSPATPIPATHQGAAPYRYGEDQLVAAWPVTVTFDTSKSPMTQVALRKLVHLLPGKTGRMVHLTKAQWLPGDRVALEGVTFQERRIKPPEHLPPPLPKLPAKHPRLAELEELQGQIQALQPKVQATLAVASVAHLLGARFSLIKTLAKRIEGSALDIR